MAKKKSFSLIGKIRKDSAVQVRAAENVPAVVYGHGVKENLSVDVSYKAFEKVLEEAGHSALVDLKIEGEAAAKEHKVIIREVQMHPVKGNILHADFYQPRLDQKTNAIVPLVFTGESVAVKDLSGVLIRNINEVEVEALPVDLPHDIEVDISSLVDFEAVIRIDDVQLPEGVTLNHDVDEVVALVQAPRTDEELEALEEDVSEDVASVEGVEDKVEGEEGKEVEQGESGEKQEEQENKTEN